MPILDESTIEFISRSPDQTRRLGARLGELLRGGEWLCLEGALGTGKTCLTQGIAAGWGVTGPVRSPTFTLVHEFHRPGDRHKLYHVDLYRITGLADAETLGLDDIWGSEHVCVIEWAERVPGWLPPEQIWIRISWLDETRRMLHFEAHGQHYEKLLKEFRRVAFGG